MSNNNSDAKSLAHTKWNCKYHIVFASKYRRKVFYNEKKEEVRRILQELCRWKGVEILGGELCPDHVHLLVSIPPKYIVLRICIDTYNGEFANSIISGWKISEKRLLSYLRNKKILYTKEQN